jgi:nitroimidazol reductase NimA-like FMN-containing flavoprotein (pyridoxamine 5'-phosphate oxidase superfamily)
MTNDVELEGLEVLTRTECVERLAAASVGRVGFVVARRPQVLPVNYALDDEATVVFRTTGRSILTQVVDQAVVFEVDGLDEAAKTGWSVCVHGIGREITGTDDSSVTRRQTMHLLSWAPGPRDRWFAIAAHELTGRRIPVVATPHDFGGWMPGIVS